MGHRVVVLNSGRMDYDHALNMEQIWDDIVIYESSTSEEIIERVQGCTIAVTKEIPVTAEMIAQFPDSLKMICEAGTGYNNIDLAAARSRGITVCNIPAYSTDRVAHTAIMLMLNLSSSVQKQIRMLERGNHDNFRRYLMVDHVELNGKTLGIIGAGNIGKAVIKIARAMDMEILIYSRTKREDEPHIHYTTLEEVLKNSDVVSLHCPLNENTRHIINAETLAMMKPTAFLVNTSRGALIDEPALIEALKTARIAGAGLDVQETEPPVDDNPLYDLENVILTPHMGWKGKETRERLISIVTDNVRSYIAGTPKNVVS